MIKHDKFKHNTHIVHTIKIFTENIDKFPYSFYFQFTKDYKIKFKTLHQKQF